MSDGDRILNFAPSFVLSAGTVTFDLARRLVLLVHYRPKHEHFLPKGRKNVGEPLALAAVRETLEETGHACGVRAHALPTTAPDPDPEPDDLHMEPIAVQQRVVDGVRKIIFWYVAVGDSRATPRERTDEDAEMFEARWVPFEEAGTRMSFEDDRKVLATALAAAERITGDGGTRETWF